MNSKFNSFWNEHGSDLQAAGANKFSAYFIWKSALEPGDVGETTQKKDRPFKEGDRVISSYYGPGYISEDDGGDTDPLGVTFYNGGFIWHSRNGKDNLGNGYITHLDLCNIAPLLNCTEQRPSKTWVSGWNPDGATNSRVVELVDTPKHCE